MKLLCRIRGHRWGDWGDIDNERQRVDWECERCGATATTTLYSGGKRDGFCEFYYEPGEDPYVSASSQTEPRA